MNSFPLPEKPKPKFAAGMLLLTAFLLFYGSGCGGGSESVPGSLEVASDGASFSAEAPPQAMRRNAPDAISRPPEPPAESENESPVERKLITDGSISFEVENLRETRRRIGQLAETHEAYIASDQEYNAGDRISINMEIRVPADNFDALLGGLDEEIRRLDNRQINVRDVTEEFVDIQARLRSKKELEARYAELLEQARAVSDMLEIERQMEQLRGQIESIEGRLRYLQDQVALSTLRLNFYERRPSDMQFGRELVDGLRSGWNNLIYFFLFMLRLWPFILLSAGLVWGLLRWRKRRKKARG